MPLYEYECTRCQHRFEKLQRYSDPPASECPVCGGPVSQLMSAPAIQFKGSGWYVTDYAKKSTSPAGSSSGKPANGASGSEAKPETSSESKSESKPEAKSEAKSETKAATETKTEARTSTKKK